MLKLVLFLSVIALAFGAPSSKGSDVDGKIVGGTTVNVAQYPWSLAFLSSNRLFCGAVLISNDVALSAAHCVVPGSYVLSALSVRAGSSQWASGGQQVGLRAVVSHQNYRTTAHDFDIAVLFLSSIVNNANARPVALAPANFSPAAGVYATITGWGTLYENGPTSAVLQMVQVPVVAWTSCRLTYGTAVTTNMWCAGYAAGGKDSCQGDSGGAAVVGNQLAGLVSFGAGCARANTPGVYASVPAFRSWIQSTSGI